MAKKKKTKNENPKPNEKENNTANQLRDPCDLINETTEGRKLKAELVLATEASLVSELENVVAMVFLKAQIPEMAGSLEKEKSKNLESLESLRSSFKDVCYYRDLFKRAYDDAVEELRVHKERDGASSERRDLEKEKREERLVPESLKAEEEAVLATKSESSEVESLKREVKKKEERVKEIVNEHLSYRETMDRRFKLVEEKVLSDEIRIADERVNKLISSENKKKEKELEMLKKTASNVAASWPKDLAEKSSDEQYSSLLEAIKLAFKSKQKIVDELAHELEDLRRPKSGKSFFGFGSGR